MSGPFDFLHIKGRTAGSSNELSFDVLDAARSGIDRKGKDKKAKGKGLLASPSAPSPKQGTYHGVAGTSTLSAVPEVERRKRARRSHSIKLGLAAFVVIVALVSAGAYAGMRIYQDRVDFSGRFAALIERFVEVDQTLVRIDELMVDSLNTVELDERNDMLDAIPELDRDLDLIAAEALDMEPAAVSDGDRAALSEVRSGVEARKTMLSSAEDAFTLSIVVNKQVGEANDAWSRVLAADTTAREATKLANVATTEDATLQAREKTSEAIAGLTSARESLAMLEKEAAGLDLSDELEYIDTRLEALEAALETADALLDNDRSAAMKANNAYNDADSQAAALAESLDTTAGDKVKALHDADASRTRQIYADARTQAATADSTVRAYLK